MENITINNRTQEVADRELSKLFDELIPPMGKADTKAGEIIRAMARLGYRYFNDGDHAGVGYGKETCNAAWRFLCEKLHGIEPTLVGIYGEWSDEKYEVGLLRVQNYVIDYILAHPELKEQANEEDMHDWRDDDEDVDDSSEEEEEEEEYEYEEEEEW